MAELSQPSEIARETLRRLAMSKTPPTPDNYRTLYHEISGIPAAEPFPERSLKSLHAGLPHGNPEQKRFARQFEAAVSGASWEGISAALGDLLSKDSTKPLGWSALIRELMQQLDTHHAGLTAAKKKEAVDRVLAASSTPELLHTRLQSVVRSWSHAPAGSDTELTGEVAPLEHEAAKSTPPAPKEPVAWRGIGQIQNLIAQLLEETMVMLLVDNKELSSEAQQLAIATRAAKNPDEISALSDRLKKFTYRAHFVAEDQVELKAALLHLIQLIIENISELVIDDQWLVGQITVVRELVSQPLSLRQLDDVERRMKDVIYKQSALKKSLGDAQNQLKQMLATFVDRLADFSETTSGYHDKIEHCANRISEAKDISQLSEVLDEVMRETRVIQMNAQRSRDELTEMRTRVNHAEKEVSRLQEELANTSEMVRHDPLTGALNRKGMDEALETEVSRARRQNGTLCIALLDIDNFKKLNDTLGHAAGDAALVHLTKVVQETIRPEDTLARYGGEEFVVLLPDTSLDSSVTAMVRVQRELTRRFFLHNNDKVLITFSCGVAELGPDEDPNQALKRADDGMYLAKRGGKNRVVPT
jgi:diguanylate cyclase